MCKFTTKRKKKYIAKIHCNKMTIYMTAIHTLLYRQLSHIYRKQKKLLLNNESKR